MANEISIHYRNRRCPRCGWRTHSSISFNYKYCPMCAEELEEYNMQDKMSGKTEPDPMIWTGSSNKHE